MADDDKKDDENKKTDDNNKSLDVNSPEVKSAIEAAVKAAITDAKEKLDKAYQARDDAVKATKELERKATEEKQEQLKKEGKEIEALNLKIEALTKEIQTLVAEKEELVVKNVSLTRDNEVQGFLVGQSFKNDKSSNYAYKEIVSQLIQDKDGKWTHKTGKSIKEFAEEYCKDPENAFLFKTPVNSGSGENNGKQPPPDSKKSGTISGLSQKEVIDLARKKTGR
jgi:vacuolar-type H+-ATPase subunit H